MLNWLRKMLFGNDQNIAKKSAIWNLISSVEYSLQSAVLMLVVTRGSENGLFDAGIFMLAYTVAQMMATIGSYGMRSFQVSDIKGEYRFETYFTSRIVSTIAMIMICVSYSLYQNYNGEKLLIIIILCFYRVVDDIEDVFHGEIQKKQRLDVASKIVAIRILLATILFGICYVLTKDLFLSSIVLTGSAIIISLLLNIVVLDAFKEIKLLLESKGVTKLLWGCLPLCLGGFLYNYLVNAPKYAIDRHLSEEMQTIFNILFMPVFAINMLSSFIFKPMIVNMGILWNDGKIKDFIKSVFRQIVFILLLTVLVALLGVTIGIYILAWMYDVNLGEYRLMFASLILFGGLAALVAFMVVVLTIIRKQRFVIIAYAIAVIVDLVLIDNMVIEYKLWGAGIVYGIAMLIVLVVLLLAYVMGVMGKDTSNDKHIENNIS